MRSPRPPGPAGAAMLLTLVVLAVLAVLVWPAAAPSHAAAWLPQGETVQAQGTTDGGFGDDATVTDEYGNSVWDYEVGGLNPRGPQDMGQAFRSLPLGLSAILFAIIQFLVAAIVWMLGFALRFGIADLLLTPVTEIVDLYRTYVDQLGLVPVALMLCVFWFGLVALRGRIGKGIGEITLSFVLVVVLSAVLAAPGQTLLGDDGLLGRTKDLGSTVAMLAVQEPAVAWRAAECGRAPAGGEALPDGCQLDGFEDRVPDVDQPEVLASMVEVWLVDMFIRQPHQHIVYGQRIDCPVAVSVRRWTDTTDGEEAPPCLPLSCVDRYNTIIATTAGDARAIIEAGDANASADPYSYMFDMMHPDRGGYGFDDGCDDAEALALAEYNQGGSWLRVAMALFTLVTLIVLFLFVAVGIVFPIAIGQIMIAVLIVALVFVLPVALLGGGSRQILWKWAGLLFGALFMIVVALFGLSLMLITTDLLLQSSWHLSVSMLLACFSSIVFLVIQRRLLKGGLAGGDSVGRALGRVGHGTRAGGSTSGPAPVAADGAWARPVDAAMNQSVRAATFGGTRQDWRRRRELTREMRNSDRVKDRHPEFIRHDMYRMTEAQDMYRAKHPDALRWRRRRMPVWPTGNEPHWKGGRGG